MTTETETSMNIKKQTSITSGSRFYQFALVQDSDKGFLVIDSHLVEGGGEHELVLNVGPRANRLSVGALKDNGFYLTLQWAPLEATQRSEGAWYMAATEERYLNANRHLPTGQLSSHQVNFLCNSMPGAPDPRMLICTNTYAGELRIVAKAQIMRGGPRVSSRWRYENIPDFPFDFYQYRPEPAHYFRVDGEIATIREMNEHGEYEYVFDLRGWPNNNPNTPVLISHGFTPIEASTSSLPADLNNDGKVDTADIGILLDAWRTQNPIGDVNRDGVVDSADLGVVVGGMGQ